MKDKHADTFVAEALELIEILESSLIDLESNPSDEELIGKVFRALHTIKGSGAMFGYENLSGFVHNIETVFDRIRNKEIETQPEIIELTLKAADYISELINNGDKTYNRERAAAIQSGYSGFLINLDEKIVLCPAQDTITGSKTTYKIKFTPSEDIFLKGTRPVGLLRELSDLGEAAIIPNTEFIPRLDSFDPEKMYTSWEVILSTDRGINAIKDVFIFVEDDCEVEITPFDSGEAKADQSTSSFVSEPASAIQTEIQKEVQLTENRPAKKAYTESSNIRVSSDKLDSLVDLVGELVTVQARLSELSHKNNIPGLETISEDVERLTWELRENALSIRMLPISSTFNKFNRLVRDLSRELGKEVELVTTGGETELDKNVIEKLNDPLVHIIRNCIDHGIEKPEHRQAAFKPARGKITLSAMHSGTHVLIKISDDGAGLSKTGIMKKAVERGLLAPDAVLSDSELFKIIFQAGFSTAANVTNVSGRGVGMDVVRSAIELLRGTVEVESKEGTGTTIILKLPLTLAIIEGLIVRIESDYYVIPLSLVEECLELTSQTRNTLNGRNLINLRDELVPFIPLREVFQVKGDLPDIEQIVIIKDSSVKTGFVVDEVIGENQTVIKSLGKFYKNIDIVSGATVLGDGAVALIIDVPKLVKSETRREELFVDRRN